MLRSCPPRRRCAILFARLGASSRGATVVEYGLIAALIVLVMMAAFRGVAGVTVSMWSNTNSRVANASNGL